VEPKIYNWQFECNPFLVKKIFSRRVLRSNFFLLLPPNSPCLLERCRLYTSRLPPRRMQGVKTQFLSSSTICNVCNKKRVAHLVGTFLVLWTLHHTSPSFTWNANDAKMNAKMLNTYKLYYISRNYKEVK